MKTFEQYMYRKGGGVLMDCPNRKLKVGKYKGKYLPETPIGYQQWAKGVGYPESLFEPLETLKTSEQDEAGGYCDEVCNTNYYGHNNI